MLGIHFEKILIFNLAQIPRLAITTEVVFQSDKICSISSWFFMFLLTWYFKVVNNIRIFVAFPVMLKIFKFLNICKRGRKRVRFTSRPLK